MRNIIVGLSLMLMVPELCAQEDTIYIKRVPGMDPSAATVDTILSQNLQFFPVITGTQKLPYTYGQFDGYKFGIQLGTVSGSECDRGVEMARSGLVEVTGIEYLANGVNIDLNITSNCCFFFLGDFNVVDSVLNLRYVEYGETHCACECCFGLTYAFFYENFNDEKKQTHLKGVMVNGDTETFWPFHWN